VPVDTPAIAPANTSVGAAPAGQAPGTKGLKAGAIGPLSNLIIGVASTAPAYSMAATLGAIVAVAGIGLSAPAVLIISFLPMLCISLAFNYMNRADPDCGITFAWVTRAMGPQLGWLNGWVIIAADIIVMSSLSQIAGVYTFKLLGLNAAASSQLDVMLVGVGWIALMTAICVIGVELNARTQAFMLTLELGILVAFSIVALVKVGTAHPPGSVTPSIGWINPFQIPSYGSLMHGVLLGLFVYWGWDAGVSVNEESRDSDSGPGRMAVLSTLLLVCVFVLVSFAAQAYAGPHALASNSSDILSFLGVGVFGPGWDKLLILVVLTSTAASTQTTILPTARCTLSMARWGAIPSVFGRIHPRYQTPWVSTVTMAGASAVLFIAMELLSQNVLADSITAIGFLIAFYYGFTGLACVVYYRRALLRSAKGFVLAGVLPLLGSAALALVFIQAYINYSKPGSGYSPPLLGIQIPIVLGIGSLLLGVVLMAVAWTIERDFFRHRPESSAPDALTTSAGERPVP
jgi:amino acid transporter